MPRFCTASLFSDSGEVRSNFELYTTMMKEVLIYISLSDSGEVRSNFEPYTPMMKEVLIYISLSDSGEVRSDFELYTLSEVEICASFAGGAEPLPYGCGRYESVLVSPSGNAAAALHKRHPSLKKRLCSDVTVPMRQI